MMSDPKPLASLSHSLLARKGAAKPAMRPQSYRFSNESPTGGLAHAQLDDLGWNDMGDDAAAPAVVSTPPVSLHNAPVATLVIPPRVLAQQEELVQHFEAAAIAAPEPAPPPVMYPQIVPPVRLAAGTKPKAAFTLRLDPERHLRLRLVCAVNHRSAQQIVTLALDEFLARQPENSRLTAQS